jgi:hypothetical protein
MARKIHRMLAYAPTKNSYRFLNFSDWPFNYWDFSNFSFCLIKLPFSCSLLLAGWQFCILWEVLCIQDAHCRIPGILGTNSIGILNAHTQLRPRPASKVLGLVHRKNWHPVRQSFHTGRFLLAVALNGLHYWSNVSWTTQTNCPPARSKVPPAETGFYQEANWNLWKIKEIT